MRSLHHRVLGIHSKTLIKTALTTDLRTSPLNASWDVHPSARWSVASVTACLTALIYRGCPFVCHCLHKWLFGASLDSMTVSRSYLFLSTPGAVARDAE